MPSVEMRRSTRVFVPKSKDGDLGRVLRSGRRLWVESPDCGFPLMNDNGKVKQQKVNGWHGVSNPVHGLPVQDPMDVDEVKPPLIEVSDQKGVCGLESRMFRNVYNRKRKRCNNVRNLGGFVDESKKFGLHFVRRKKRRALGNVDGEFRECVNCMGLCVVVEGSSFFSRVLSLILNYVGEGRVGLAELSGFLVSSPVSTVFASSGVHFLWNRCPIKSKGLCRIVGERQKTAMFTIDFMAAPQCFQHISFALLIRSVRLSCLYMIDFPRKNENDGTDELLPYINDQNVSSIKDNVSDEFLLNINEKIESPPDLFQNDQNVSSKKDDVSDKFPRNVDEKIERSPGVVLALAAVCGKDVKPVHKISGAAKTSVRNVPLRIGVRTRSSSKRRRRSLRSRRARNPLHLVLQKLPLPPLSTDLVSLKKQKTINCVSPKKIVPSWPISPRQELRKCSRKNSDETQVQNANPLGLSVDIYSQSCFANILVVESDKCYRVEGAEVMLEASASNEWNLVVKKDGSTRYSFKVQREMRPGATNRYTHAFIWTLENGWKLEFPERNEWVVFKELYKVCGEKNIVPASPVKIIPIPEVCEVKNQLETSGAFKRPKAYIKTNGDELSRTLSRKTASYDMDSDDEEWLRKFNSELDDSNCVSDVSFELMIDAFEKASYCKQEDVNDEKAAASLCSDVGGKEVAEPVYKYWMNKRKQKRAPLLRVFQLNQPTRAPLISKPVLRKKRSLKRSAAQPIQRGHGKDSTVLQVAAEQCGAEEQSALLRVQEAKASAEKSVELAILKRQRAQFLMENADLAMYRATVALRIADAAALILDSQQAANHFLD